MVDDLIPLREASALAGAGKTTLRDWIKARHLTEEWGYRAGRRERRISRAQLTAFLERRRVQADSADYRADSAERAARAVHAADAAPPRNARNDGTEDAERAAPAALSAPAATVLHGLTQFVERHQTALEATWRGRLADRDQQMAHLVEENGRLRTELDAAQFRIRELEQIPGVPQVAAVWAALVARRRQL